MVRTDALLAWLFVKGGLLMFEHSIDVCVKGVFARKAEFLPRFFFFLSLECGGIPSGGYSSDMNTVAYTISVEREIGVTYGY